MAQPLKARFTTKNIRVRFPSHCPSRYQIKNKEKKTLYMFKVGRLYIEKSFSIQFSKDKGNCLDS